METLVPIVGWIDQNSGKFVQKTYAGTLAPGVPLRRGCHTRKIVNTNIPSDTKVRKPKITQRNQKRIPLEGPGIVCKHISQTWETL